MMLPLPLALRRALDLTSSVAGAVASRWLADFGSEVILVERPGKERDRSDVAAATELLRNKYCCSIDPGTEEGRDLCLRLAAKCDVVFIDEDDEALRLAGLDGKAFRAVRSNLIVIVIGEGGTRQEVGVTAAAAALAALFRHRISGEGQEIRVALPRLQTSMNVLPIATASAGREVPSPDLPLSGVYRCMDGAVAVVLRSRAEVAALSELLKVAEGPLEARGMDLKQPLAGWLRQRETGPAVDELLARGIAAQPLVTREGLAHDPHLSARGIEEPVAAGGEVRSLEGVRVPFSRTPGHVRMPAGRLGEHNAYILGDLLGLGAEETERLTSSGVVGRGPSGAQ